MRHYEIVFLVHPDQSEQVSSMVNRYKQIATSQGGQVHRLEDWGRRQLAYPINNVHKAHYVLMNIECGQESLAEIENTFQFNDAVMRHMTMLVKSAVTEPSTMMDKAKKDHKGKKEFGSSFGRKKLSGFSGGKMILDYKDPDVLRKFTTESGKIVPSRITGVSAWLQRQLSKAIKRSRYLALLPYCDRHDN